MRQKHEQLNAYIIHSRPFRETSLLVDFFTKELGRCSAIAKGAYRGKSLMRLLLQPFRPLKISLQGSTELLTLTQVENLTIPEYLEGRVLVCGMYLNELLYHLLHREDPHPGLFEAYQKALMDLSCGEAATLREFELTLLDELGYGIHFERASDLMAEYQYHPQEGFKRSISGFSGELLRQIAERKFEQKEVLVAAKQLTRLALDPLLNGKEIRSRELL